MIKLEKVTNARDIGGITTKYGTIQTQRLIRSGKLFSLTDDDVNVLRQLGLQRVIDLRTEKEMQKVPDFVIENVTYVHNPIISATTFGITYEKSDGKEIATMLENGIVRMVNRGETPSEHMEILYRSFVGDKFCMKGLGSFLKTLANDAVEGATLWHCSAGKDRVGICTALLLHCLGASKQQIMDDYLLTNVQTKPFVDMVLKKVDGHVTEKRLDLIKSMITVRESFLQSFYNEAEKHYGNLDNFVAECGVKQQDLANLRKNYLL